MRRMAIEFVVVFGCVSFFCGGTSMASPKQNAARANLDSYAASVIAVDKFAGEIVASEGLLGDELFKKLADEGAINSDNCIQFLTQQEYTPQQRMIAILSMHKLGVHEYVAFLRKLVGLFDRGLLSRNELGLAVVPSFAFSTVLVENYAESDVRSVLKEIAERSDVRPATKAAAQNILAGRALDDLRVFRRDCCSSSGKRL